VLDAEFLEHPGEVAALLVADLLEVLRGGVGLDPPETGNSPRRYCSSRSDHSGCSSQSADVASSSGTVMISMLSRVLMVLLLRDVQAHRAGNGGLYRGEESVLLVAVGRVARCPRGFVAGERAAGRDLDLRCGVDHRSPPCPMIRAARGFIRDRFGGCADPHAGHVADVGERTAKQSPQKGSVPMEVEFPRAPFTRPLRAA
jgi:hypothetical protein